jgi:hypothetical protein
MPFLRSISSVSRNSARSSIWCSYRNTKLASCVIVFRITAKRSTSSSLTSVIGLFDMATIPPKKLCGRLHASRELGTTHDFPKRIEVVLNLQSLVITTSDD